MDAPRLTLRQQDIDALHEDFPVVTVKVYVAEEDWEPFIAMAYEGMEIPVHVEGPQALAQAAVLVGACHHDKSITVVI